MIHLTCVFGICALKVDELVIYWESVLAKSPHSSVFVNHCNIEQSLFGITHNIHMQKQRIFNWTGKDLEHPSQSWILSLKDALLIRLFERIIGVKKKCRPNEVESVHWKVAATINTRISIWASSASQKISNGMDEHILYKIIFLLWCWNHFTNSRESQLCNESFLNALDRSKLHHGHSFNDEQVNFYRLLFSIEKMDGNVWRKK